MTDPVAPITDFSQLAYVYTEPECHAVLKQDFEDFQVEEIIGFEFSGSGDHLCLQIRKIDLTTIDVAKIIARVYGVRLADIGYGGMKDRRGVCTQWFSIPRTGNERIDPAKLENDNLTVIDARDNDRKIRIGSHRANLFKICLRELKGAEIKLRERVTKIASEGVPNYFGPQRFGRNMANLHRAREYFADLGEPATDRLSKKFRKGFRKSMMLSSVRSFLFNKILSSRVENGSWNQIMDGEIFNLDGTGRFFDPYASGQTGSEAEEADAALQEKALRGRLEALDVHPTGLLFGKINPKDRYLASGAVAQLENSIVSQYPEMCQGLVTLGVDASRRALRLVPGDLRIRTINPDTVELQFSLGTGSYATAVLREICQTHEPSASGLAI
ncbi:MAG: tRNA pseudouridine(13) synthase TruD [Gammaproteobacteria bacterium]|nr:tRNA pseudouridine(13) synthase TruD [Gammaproteobacteria bacterium]